MLKNKVRLLTSIFFLISYLGHSQEEIQLLDQFELELSIQESNEYSDVDPQEYLDLGWQLIDEDEGIFQFKKTIRITQDLPFSKGLDLTYIRIDNAGVVNLGAEYGDYDASAKTSTTLPFVNNQLVYTGKEIVIELSGGDHASGAWYTDSKAVIRKTTP